jgi:hypothetical protein
VRVSVVFACTAALLFFASPAASYTVRGAGVSSCGAWSKERVRGQSVIKGTYLAWVMGYLSRAAGQHQGDILAFVDPDAVEGWLDNYCDKNPLDNIVDAAEKLEAELVGKTRPRPPQRK